MIVGIDVGTTSVKGLLLDENAQIVKTAEVPHQLFSNYPGFAEEDPEAWWKGAKAAIEMLFRGANLKAVHAIGIAGMVPALVITRHGRPLRYSIQQNDARAVEEIMIFKRRFGDEWLFNKTGATWNQQVLPPKLLWLLKHEPDVLEQADWICGSYEYVAFQLTGVRYSEINWALESGMYDFRHRAWIPELLEFLGVSQELFAPIRFPYEVIGEVTNKAAQDTGLPAGTPVIAGSADHIAAALAAGLLAPGEALLKFGAAGDFLYVSADFAPIPELFIDFHDVPGLYVLNGCMATSGSLLRWFRDQFRLGVNFADLDREAEKISPGADGLVVLPYFLGEKTPIHDPQARGTVLGLTLSHTPAHLYRALLEGVAYAFRHHVEVLENKGYKIERIFVADGGARSPLWRKITASVLNRPVEYLAQSERGSCYGVAFLAGVAVRLWDIQDLSRRVVSITDPEREWALIYQELYQIYRTTYSRLQDLYPRLRSVYA